MGWKLSRPQAFERMPLTYERAFGGSDLTHKDEKKHVVEMRNPLGTGIWVKGGGVKCCDVKPPNLEDPENLMKKPMDRPEPAGFGFVCSHWEPRLGLAGTHDEVWQAERMPLLPDDFDPKHNQSAHPSMLYDGFLQGDERVQVEGISAGGKLDFLLPNIQPACRVDMAGGHASSLPMNLEKFVVDGHNEQVVLVWSRSYAVHRRLYEVEEVLVRELEPVALAQ